MIKIITILALWLAFSGAVMGCATPPTIPINSSALKSSSMNTQICNKCGIDKLISEFPKHKDFYLGVNKECKACKNIKTAIYRRTKPGLITKIYHGQKLGSRIRSYKYPEYTRQELSEWLMSQPVFHTLFDEWVKSDYNRWFIPSCDRLDDYKSYSFENIEVTTWLINSQRGHERRRNGQNNKQSVALMAICKDTGEITEYYSVAEAVRRTGASPGYVAICCRERWRTSAGYYWSKT